jgi:hypothetical protein
MPQKQKVSYQTMPPPPSQNHKRGEQSATPKQLKVKQNIPTILYSITPTTSAKQPRPQARNNNNNNNKQTTIQSPNRSNSLTDLQTVIAYKR